MNTVNILIVLSLSVFACLTMLPNVHAVSVYQKNETAFGKTYDGWVEDWWRWNAALRGGEDTTYADLKEGGCLIDKDGPVVMLIDPAAAGNYKQVCEISSNQGILLSAWGAVCSRATEEFASYSFEQLSTCAKGFNQGTVTVNVDVDNKPIAEVKAKDGKTVSLVNASEVATKEFYITFPENSNFAPVIRGSHLSATDGWYVFLKPLPVGEHTVYYKNAVVGENANNAEITYLFKVK